MVLRVNNIDLTEAYLVCHQIMHVFYNKKVSYKVVFYPFLFDSPD